MAKICPICKKEFADDIEVCTVCNQPLETVAESAPAQETPTQETPAQAQAQTQAQPQPQVIYQAVPQYQYVPVAQEELFPAVRTSVYFWLNIAMTMPFVGFVLSIILSFAPKNRSLKNYAKAYLIVNLIIIGIGLTGIILALVLGGLPAILESFSGGGSDLPAVMAPIN